MSWYPFMSANMKISTMKVHSRACTIVHVDCKCSLLFDLEGPRDNNTWIIHLYSGWDPYKVTDIPVQILRDLGLGKGTSIIYSFSSSLGSK